MEDKRFTFIDKALSTYDFGTVQNLKMMLLNLEQSGISHNELDTYINLKSSAISNNRPAGVLCPECKAPMSLEYVNVNGKTLTGDDSKLVYTCRNYNCMHQIFE